MVDNFSSIKTKVLLLTGLTTSAQLELKLNIGIDEILAYCNRSDIPANMENLVVEILAERLTEGAKEVSSYREGDVSISYANTERFNGRLNPFRLIGTYEISEVEDET